MKTGPFLALTTSVLIVSYIYMSPLGSKVDVQKDQFTLEQQIENALFDIQNGQSPEAQMKGILKMRALSEEHPENSDLQWNMGLFSMQSGQYEKAVSRFKKVISLDSERLDAKMQMAISYSALNDTLSACFVLSELIEASEGEVKTQAQALFEKLKKY